MHKQSIVVVEDEPIVMAGLCSIINSENYGWTVVGTADNGQEGLKIIRELKPDIILTDIRMPYLDGLELIKRVRQQDEEVVIIILTGHADFSYAQLALKYGVFDYILKPSSPKEIISVLEKAGAAITKLKSANNKNKPGSNKENISVGLKEFIHSPEFFDYITDKDAGKAVDKYMDETCKNGFWGLELRKAIKITGEIFAGLAARLSDDRMLTLCNLMKLKQFLLGMYQIKTTSELQAFSKQFIEKMMSLISFNCSSNMLIKKALDYIDSHIASDISLKDIADKLFLNYSYFSQLFKKETSMNFSDYLIYARMEKAREYLSDIKYKTYEVASNVGYSNAKHFSYTFKKTYEMSPSEYRSMFLD